MRVSGFSIVRNGVKYAYPFVESIRSLLPLVDEMIIGVGDSDDDTMQRIRSIDSDKIKIFETVWDPAMRSGGQVMAHQTNLALDRCTGDWCFYLQADEVIHEQQYDTIRDAMQSYLPRKSIQGLWFRYKHLMGSYDIRNTTAYRKQVRIVRGGVGIRSVGDACGFGKATGKKLRVRIGHPTRSCGANIYHYGWVKPPITMSAKMENFLKYYDDAQGVPEPKSKELKQWQYDFAACVAFNESHPRVMHDLIAAKDWQTPPFHPVPIWRNKTWWHARMRKLGLVNG